MLDRMLQHAERQQWRNEPGFARKTVRWALLCSQSGAFQGVVPLGDGDSGLTYDACPDLAQGEMVSGSETRSQFLIESLQTIACWWKDDTGEAEQETIRAKQRYFMKLLEKSAAAVPRLKPAALLLANEEALHKIRQTLSSLTPKPRFTDRGAIIANGYNPLEHTDWHEWWRTHRQQFNPVSTGLQMRSLISGELVHPAITHRKKIRGLSGVGGLGMGDVLIGFDKDAFQSYGLKQSTNAAIDESTCVQYAETLSRLIQENSVRLVNVLAVYWYDHTAPEQDDPDDPLAFLKDPAAEGTPEPGAEHHPRQLLESLRLGQRPELLTSQYHALVLSGASGRVMVRNWIEVKFEELLRHILTWFNDLAIVARNESQLAPLPKFMAVVGSLLREEEKLSNTPPSLVTGLWQSAVIGLPLPHAALTAAFLRFRADIVNGRPINHAGVGLMKAYHRRNKGDEAMQTHLNPEHPAPAYHCGRLLAVLSRLQYRALGDVGAGVVQRYYGAASQTPALTIGRLMNNAKNHLNKLEGGLADWHEQQIAAIMGRIGDAFPRTLDLEEQSLFALGYYQQLARPKDTPS